MPDEAQQPTQPDDKPTARRTAMAVAESAEQTADSALRLAQSVDDSLGALRTEWSNELEQFSEKLTGLDGRLTELREAEPTGDAPNRDQVDGRIAEALAPFKEEVGGYQGAVNRKLDAHATRLSKVEKTLESIPTEQNAGAVFGPEALDGIKARLEAAERKVAEASHAGEGLPLLAREQLVQLLQRVEALENTPSITAAPGRAPRPFGVRRKVLQLMRSVDAIGKDRHTDSGPRYQYRSIDDAMDAVGHAMRDVGLVLETRILDRQVSHNVARNDQGRELLWTTVQLTTGYTFVDPEDNSEHSFEMAGEGRAADDKATSKATAMALKYGLLHALMIPVKGMPDGDAESPQVSSAPRQDEPARQAQQPDQGAGGGNVPSKMQRARDAKTALDNLHLVPAAERYNRFVSIGNLASQEGLLNVVVDDATVRAWLGAAEQTLQAARDDQARDNGAAF